MQTILLLLLLLLAAPAGARAQGTPRDTSTALVLPGLTVTVLRTPIEVVRAPYAVGVNTQQEVQRARPGLGLDEALRGIPGVQVDNRYNYALGERISIRGFGARAQFGVRGVKVMLDGIPATFPDGQTSLSHVDPGFLRRVEVVRGPASALYGSSAGGVVQFETEAAPTGPLGQEVGITAGSRGLVQLHSTTGGTQGPSSYLLNVSHVDYNGPRSYNEVKNLHLDGRFGYVRENSELRVSGSFVDYDAQNPGSLSDSLLRVDRTAAFANNVRNQTGESGRQGQVGATWRQGVGPGSVELMAYGIKRNVDNPIPATIVVLDRKAGGGRALYRLGNELVNWSAGVETGLQRDNRQNYANLLGERAALQLDQAERVTNLAGFTEATLAPTARLTLLGGARYDWYRFGADDHIVTATNPDDSGERTMKHLSPSLGISYELASVLHVYGNVATSLETPTTTELANRPSGAGGFNPDLKPQTAVSYEVGGKGNLTGWVRYELSAYRADVKNELIPFQVPQAPDRNFFRNAGSGRHQGVEAGLIVAPYTGVMFRTAYSYTDARFRDYSTATTSFNGKKLPGVAPHNVEVDLSGRDRRGWFASLEGRYASKMPVNDANTFFSPSYKVLDGRLGVEGVKLIPGFSVDPFAGVTNIFETKYNTSVTINAFGGRYYEPGPGRAFYVGLNARAGSR
jgi:iron complex outermembrane receptor protein